MRIIPAYAGSTCEGRLDWGVPCGSSPHTRGARAESHLFAEAPGIIPAYAGSTTTKKSLSTRIADHPRIRGEHAAFVTAYGRQKRIIPAYAGSTACATSARRRAPDHPRIRGEHAAPSESDKWDEGSSPHTRGAHGSQRREGEECRIIPAYAGSTFGKSTAHPTPTDHPRIRGEHGTNNAGEYARPGSSPHTRGAPSAPWWRRRRRRIIPAYAGSAGPGIPSHIGGAGSSPHTRGAP